MTSKLASPAEPLETPSLNDLGRVALNPRNRAMLDGAMHDCGGDAATRNRKLLEAQELLALSQLAPPGRLHVDQLDLSEHLRAIVSMEVRVACRPNANNELQIRNRVLLGFTYPLPAFQRPMPGYQFFQIILPRDVWLAQVHQPEQSLCIAPQVPAGSRTAMLFIRAYAALSMQSVQFEVKDPAGVFDPAIATWWQHNLHRVPLTDVAFLQPNKTNNSKPKTEQSNKGN